MACGAGRENLAVRLVSAEGQPLPAWTPGAHIDLHLPCGLIRQYSLTGSPAERDRYLLCIARESQSRGGSVIFMTPCARDSH